MCFASLAIFAAIFSFAVGGAFAQDYPVKPIHVIVPTGAGGSTDTAARIVGEKLSVILGQPALIENKPGADSRIGCELVARAAPNGYTLLMTSNSISQAPSIFKNLSYNPVKDFVPITLLTVNHAFLLVHPSCPAKSVADFIKLAKSKPGKLNFGSSGVGQTPHLNMELLKMKAGIDMMHVAFKGSGEAMISLLGGHTDTSFASIASSIQHVNAGTLRALAVTSAKRLPLAPDVPTLVESGFPDFVTSTWNGTFAPAGTPKDIVTKLNTAIVKVLEMPDVRERMLKAGFEPTSNTPEELAEVLKSEIVLWRKVIESIGIQPG